MTDVLLVVALGAGGYGGWLIRGIRDKIRAKLKS